MFPPDNLNPLIKELINRLGGNPHSDDPNGNKTAKRESTGNRSKGYAASSSGASGNGSKTGKISLTPSQALIIAGLLGGVLEVDSVLVDRDQTVQIVLAGSLKEKTKLEKIMDEIGNMPFDEVMKAVIDRLS